jgi:hypothetical protein
MLHFIYDLSDVALIASEKSNCKDRTDILEVFLQADFAPAAWIHMRRSHRKVPSTNCHLLD